MNETDAMRLLADANPVRAGDLEELAMPKERHRPRRRLALAVAATAVAAAASLIGVYAFGGSPSGPLSTRGLSPLPTIEHPLRPDATQVTLPEAIKKLGAQIVLPDSSFARASDVGAIWTENTGPVTDVAVTFPGPALIVDYERPVPYPEPVPAMYATEAKQNPDSVTVVDLNGVPAMATAQNSDQLHQNFGSIEFVENGTVIRVMGHYDEATLQAVAQSIVDRMGGPTEAANPVEPIPSQPIPFANAAAALGAPVVLPDTPLISPSDIGSVTKECPGPWGKTCAIDITFPSEDVRIRYTNGGYQDPLTVYRAEGGRSTVVYLSGNPALLMPQDPNDTAGTASYIEFQLNGLTIAVVARHYDGPTVQSIAQSIVDRSQSQ